MEECMDKEKLVERKKDLEGGLKTIEEQMRKMQEQFNKLVANRAANITAIREIDYWIGEIEKPSGTGLKVKVKEKGK
jgi:hypothetical protein